MEDKNLNESASQATSSAKSMISQRTATWNEVLQNLGMDENQDGTQSSGAPQQNSNPPPDDNDDADIKESVKKIKCDLHGKTVTLEKLLGESTSIEIYKKIYHEYYDVERTCKCILNKDFVLTDLPKYYIPRTVFYINELNRRIFTSESTKTHVFLFRGMCNSALEELSGSNGIDVSGNQLHRLTVRFILLESDDHCEIICRMNEKYSKTPRHRKLTPIHVIQYDDGRFFWIKSNKNGVDEIRQFFKEEGKFLDEQEMISKIMSLSPPCSINIADCPGAGKSLLLAKLATSIRENIDPQQSMVLFITLPAFMKYFRECSGFSAIEALANYSAVDKEVDKLILTEALKNENRQLYLFLDGYDEVMDSKLTLKSCIQDLQALKNTNVIMTTRTISHLKTSLENIYCQFSFKILPLHQSNQITLFTKDLISHDSHAVPDNDSLREYAQKSNEALMDLLNHTDMENEIAGLPLKCMMFAELSIRWPKPKDRPDTGMNYANIEVAPFYSLIQIYEQFIRLKFRRSPKVLEAIQNYKNAHVFEAIKLLFPQWIDKFRPLLSSRVTVDTNDGLLQHWFSSSPMFVHRSIADYLLAEFIVKNLENVPTCVDFLFRSGICGRHVADHLFNYHYDLKYPAIAYFIEMLLTERLRQQSINSLVLSDISSSTNINSEDVCKAVVICCCNGMESTFTYVSKVLLQLGVDEELRDRYLKTLPSVIVKTSRNIDMLEKRLGYISVVCGVDFSSHTYMMTFGNLRIPEGTPLHVAVHEGNYKFVSKLIGKYGEKVDQLKYLLHVCVYQSERNNDSVINDKLFIIDLLVGINRTWLEEKYDLHEPEMGGKCTPVLQHNVHLNLLKRLVQHGANINAYSSKYGTVLHRSVKENTLNDLIRWALSSGFKLINHKDRFGRTPLMHFIKEFGTVDDEVLRLVQDAWANIDAKDNRGDSILFYALRYSEDIDLILYIFHYGANVNHTNDAKQNAAHVVMEHCVECEHAIFVLELLELKGFNQFNEKDLYNCKTPLEFAEERENVHEGLLAFLRERMTTYANYKSDLGKSANRRSFMGKKIQKLKQLAK